MTEKTRQPEEKRDPPKVEEVYTLCKKLQVPGPRHMKGKNGKVMTWVDAIDFLRLLRRLDREQS